MLKFFALWSHSNSSFTNLRVYKFPARKNFLSGIGDVGFVWVNTCGSGRCANGVDVIIEREIFFLKEDIEREILVHRGAFVVFSACVG